MAKVFEGCPSVQRVEMVEVSASENEDVPEPVLAMTRQNRTAILDVDQPYKWTDF